ncbi:MAG: MOSC domain-containing protein [Acidimicrobiales bacterium]
MTTPDAVPADRVPADPVSDLASPQRVAQLWRFPVKSMGGERLDTVVLTSLGIEGDRIAGIEDLASGTILTARRTPELLFATARYVDGEVAITLPDGTEGPDDAALSSWLGRDVALRSAVGTDEGGTYEVPLDAENDADWVQWTGPGGAFHDSARTRVSLLGLETVAAWGIERFRANVWLTGGGEDALERHRVRLGAAELTVRKKIDRCVMISKAFPGGLERDLGVLKAVIAERENFAGIGALVAEGGTVAEGDEVSDLGAFDPAAG